jgi:hypothetical protein
MKNGNNYLEIKGAPDEECWVEKRSTTNGIGEVRNDNEEREL